MSRATVRDAVKVLTGKGLLRTARRFGTKVRLSEHWNLLDAEVISWHEPHHAHLGRVFVESTELRYVIEPAAAQLAAENATSEHIRVLLRASAKLNSRERDTATLFAADCQFHSTVLDAAGNMMLGPMRQMILGILKISYEFGVQQAPRGIASRERHTLVAEAIRDRDGVAARSEMEKMLDANRQTAREYWKERAKTED